jgi:hypothetical protein
MLKCQESEPQTGHGLFIDTPLKQIESLLYAEGTERADQTCPSVQSVESGWLVATMCHAFELHPFRFNGQVTKCNG